MTNENHNIEKILAILTILCAVAGCAVEKLLVEVQGAKI